MIHAFFKTKLGPCGITWENQAISSFLLLQSGRSDKNLPRELTEIITDIQATIASRILNFSNLPLAWERVTPFQKEVYKASLKVPSGEVITYGELAELMGRSKSSSRAIGGALGKNPWPLLIPCHRFIGCNKKLVGYSAPGGIDTKQRILDWEHL